MPVQITIQGDFAKDALSELRELSAGMFVQLKPFVPEVGVIGSGGVAGSTATEADTKVKGTRRTKAQIEADAKAASPATEPGAQQAISTGGERADPETKEQDKQDEAADKDVYTLTSDDVRSAANGYIKKFGMDAAQEDLMHVLKAATGKFSKFSELVGADQETLRKAKDGVDAAVSAEKRHPKPALD